MAAKSFFIDNTFLTMSKLLGSIIKVCIVDLVKHFSLYSTLITSKSEWHIATNKAAASMRVKNAEYRRDQRRCGKRSSGL